MGFEVSSTKVSLTFGLAPNWSPTDDSRFYIVAYDGLDPLRSRVEALASGRFRSDDKAIAATIDVAASPPPEASPRSLTVGRFLTEQWMRRRRA